MAKVQDVAKFFIDLSQKQSKHHCGDLMTNLRLQKLLYFAQGWHLSRHGRPLFDAPIMAWKYGPVVREIYDHYKGFNNNGIAIKTGVHDAAFTDDERLLLLDVASEYNKHSTPALVGISHKPGSPWHQTEQPRVIPIETISNYFSAIDPQLASFNDFSSKIEVYTPEYTEDGTPIIPLWLADGWENDDDWDKPCED